jgi:hypothetical protein
VQLNVTTAPIVRADLARHRKAVGMATTSELKMAAASRNDLDELCIFMQQLESIRDSGRFLRRADWGQDAEKQVEATPSAVFELVYEAIDHLVHGWERVVLGYEVMFTNFCQPDSPVLARDPARPQLHLVDWPTEPGNWVEFVGDACPPHVVEVSQAMIENREAIPKGLLDPRRFLGPLPAASH